jgi:hypothetical protein
LGSFSFRELRPSLFPIKLPGKGLVCVERDYTGTRAAGGVMYCNVVTAPHLLCRTVIAMASFAALQQKLAWVTLPCKTTALAIDDADPEHRRGQNARWRRKRERGELSDTLCHVVQNKSQYVSFRYSWETFEHIS